MSGLVDLLEAMRGVCVRAMEGAFSDLRKAKQEFIAEATMQDSGDLAREGPLSLPFRCDALVISRDEKTATPHIFAVQRRMDFSPIELDYGGLRIALSTCHWEQINVAISGDPEAVAAGVKDWFEAVFVPAEQHGDDEIQNVVHDISAFRAEGDVTTFILDCGTMPVDQMFALFDHSRAAGATRVELSMS